MPHSSLPIGACRGLHCPICTSYLADLERMTADFSASGVSCVAISMDDQSKAEAMAKRIPAQQLRIGYDLPIAMARTWGLYLSKAMREAEPGVFSEPGIYLVKPDRTLF